MSNIATITLAYDVLRLDEKLIIEELRKHSVDFALLNLENFVVNVSDLKQLVTCNVLLLRSISHSRCVLTAKLFEEVGVQVVNSSSAIELGYNKLLTLAKLARAGLPVPETVLAFNPEVLVKAVESLGLLGKNPLVLKPISGSWGRLVSLVYTVDELKLLLRHRMKMENPQMRLLLAQEYIEKPQRDIRIIVINGEAVAGIYRYAPEGEWRTNTARGGIAKPLQLNEELRELSVKACEIVGAKYAGVDIVESRDGYKILEVNVVPEFKNVMRVTGVNIAAKIVEMLLSLARR